MVKIMHQLLSTITIVAIQYFPLRVNAQSAIPSDSIQQVLAAKLMTNFADGNFYTERLRRYSK